MQHSLPLFPSETSPHPLRRPVSPLRPHQREAVDAIVRALENPDVETAPDGPHGGTRATVAMACGTGKTRIAAAVAAALAPRGRALVLVPTLDLLTQTVTAWRNAGRTAGTQIAVCSLANDPTLDEAGVRCTTSAPRLALWASAQGPLTVYATYQSLGAVLTAQAGVYGLALAGFDLVIVDEAHRTSGSIGKEWAAVHDNTRLPAARRLYLTATPRVWEPPGNSAYSEATTSDADPELPPALAEDDVWEDLDPAVGEGDTEEWAEGGGDDRPVRVRGGRPVHSALKARAVASMDDEAIFGPVVHRLELAAASRMGLIARPRVVVVEITDPQVQELAAATGSDLNRGLGRRSIDEVEQYRAARLVALQTALLRAAADDDLDTVIAYHSRTLEAQACAASLPDVAARLHQDDPGRHPAYVWTDWLSGEHPADHRRDVLARFVERADPHGTIARRAVLSNVRVLAEGVDLRARAVAFMDPKFSIVEIVQAIGRALRQNPGEGRTATIIVPVFLAPGERPDDMLVSDSYHPLVRTLHALAAHDARVLDMLATPAPSGPKTWARALTDTEDIEERGDVEPGDGDESDAGGKEERFLVRFMTDRDPTLLRDFINLRVINPERRDWRRGYQAAKRWHTAHGHLRVPLESIDYDSETGTSYPLGQWIGDQRRARAEGSITPHRIELLEGLGMVWNTDDTAFEDGLAISRAHFAVHGHLAAPKPAAINGYPVGQFLANCRRPLETRKNPERWRERWARLAEIDPDWNSTGRPDPAQRWSLDWQRVLAAVRLHTEAGGSVDDLVPGHTVGGEDVGAWLQRQRRSGAGLTPAQREALAGVGVHVTEQKEQPAMSAAGVVRADRWALTLAAAAAFREREGHLTVPRKHVESVEHGGEAHRVKLGVALANARQRRATYPPERLDALSALGMRWA
ncbi:Helicase associated domain protein (plasmid) [Embleya sp. NBC_00888]|uniref:DEAD/DEAH box helicase n=1 Tax=Embleya sp. NBC_00888 TaxID=2975960 RepID=UPI002F90A8A6|nr:Helicase associated domain protein [Embleya sp. NBC_00888]